MNITEKVKDLHSQGLTNLQITEQTGFSKRQVLSVLQKQGLSSNRYEILKQDDNFKQFIIGSILGDGSIESSGRLTFGHSEKQLDYLKWKLGFLKSYSLSNGTITKCTQVSTRYKSGECTSYHSKSKTHSYFKDLRKTFYSERKNIEKDLIKEMNEFGLAIWYMDDGGICTRSYQINSQSFTNNEVEFLIKILKTNFNIEASYDKNNVIYIKTCSKELFKNLIEPYVIPCMKYKLRGSE